jgi:hypothetical protein
MLQPSKKARRQSPLSVTLNSRRSILGACLVRDANGQALGGEVLTKDEARQIAANRQSRRGGSRLT